MGRSYAEGLANCGMDREMGLRAHLAGNFFPPLPGYVVESTVQAFKDHWDGNLELNQDFADRCYLRAPHNVAHYHGPFLNSEEFDDED